MRVSGGIVSHLERGTLAGAKVVRSAISVRPGHGGCNIDDDAVINIYSYKSGHWRPRSADCMVCTLQSLHDLMDTWILCMSNTTPHLGAC